MGVTWVRLTPPLPFKGAGGGAAWAPRDFHTVSLLPDGSVVLIAGQNFSGLLDDVWRFNPVGSTSGNPIHTFTSNVNTVTLQVYTSNGFTNITDGIETSPKNATYSNAWTRAMTADQHGVAVGYAYAPNTSPTVPEIFTSFNNTDNTGDVGVVTKFGVMLLSTSGTIITHAHSGNIYNLGGVSSEPTDHIVITMWDNDGYDSYGSDSD